MKELVCEAQLIHFFAMALSFYSALFGSQPRKKQAARTWVCCDRPPTANQRKDRSIIALARMNTSLKSHEHPLTVYATTRKRRTRHCIGLAMVVLFFGSRDLGCSVNLGAILISV